MRHLGLFAKYWAPGQVKTRLAGDLGAQVAASLSKAFLATLLDRFAESYERRSLIFTPATRREAFCQIAGDRWHCVAQCGGDLGTRLAAFLRKSLLGRGQRIVILGSDSPDLPRDYVDQAFEHLNRVPTVIGPAADGGYYLLGVRENLPPIFDGIAWGTDAVWSQTVSALKRVNWPYATVPQWYDVDRRNDLDRLRAEISRQADCEPGLAGLEQVIAETLGAAND